MLTVRDIHFSYGPKPVLQAVDLHVSPGEMVGLIGPNGAGKSTLLRLITRLRTPQRGSITVAGTDVARLGPRRLAKQVAVLPQSPNLPLAFTALELVLMGRTPHLGPFQFEGRADLELAREAMEATDTWQFATDRIENLSGGERQRVLIARALVQQAPLLLLDEPTAHLDVGHQHALFQLARRLLITRRVTAILAAIHDLTLAGSACDRLYLLAHGTVLAEGTPREVLTAENIARAYGAQVHILPHPEQGSPVVVPAHNGHETVKEYGSGRAS